MRFGTILAILLALGLIVLGVSLPSNGVDAQTALNPVDPALLVKGQNYFKWGLIVHGILLLGLLPLLRRHTFRTDDIPLLSDGPANSPPPTWARTWLLPAILAAALGLRCVGLDSCLWYDEVVTLTEFVRLPLGELLHNYVDQNQHPLYSVLAHGSVAAFGESAWALRLPAVLFGVGSLWIVFHFARRFVAGPEPLLAMLLLAVSYHHVWFSQNARGYTGLLFWTLLGSWLLVDNLRRPHLGRSIAYGAVMALALYTHLTAVFVVASHGLIYLALLMRQGVRRRRLATSDLVPALGFVLLASLTFQLYALVLPQVVASFQKQTDGLRVQEWTDWTWGLQQALQGLQLSFAGMIGVVAAAAVAAVGLVSLARRNPVVVALLVLPCLIGVAVMLKLNRHLYPRFFFPVFPFAALVTIRGALVVGEALSSLLARKFGWGKHAGIALATLAIVVSAASLPLCYRYPRQDYLGALAYVHAARDAADPVVTVGMAAIPFGRYYAPEFRIVESAKDLQAIRVAHSDRSLWLLYTFRDHMVSYHPDVLDVIDRDFHCVKTFPGTVPGGEVLICRCRPARDASAAQDTAPARDAVPSVSQTSLR